jgi:polyhydroxybutyrate depolymerase
MSKGFFFSILLSLIFSTIEGQQTITGALMHDGLEREYRLYLPSAYDEESSLSLVFNLHGFTSNAQQQEFYSAMNDTAEEQGFIVCYPEGVSNAWNVGWTFGSTADDVGFLSAMIDELIENYNVDPMRVYSCGMSNGGFMSYRLACELNDRIAAVASVTGSIVPEYKPDCNPEKSVPIMEIHGTADDVVPYNGSADISLPVDEVVAFWVDNNECNTDPMVSDIPDNSPSDGSTAQRFDYNMCKDEKDVVLIKIENGGHTWPGAPVNIGSTNQDFSASDAIWEFFDRHSLDLSASNENLFTGDIKIGPNPASEYIEIESTLSFDISLYNLHGRILWSGANKSNSLKIDTRNLNSGVYFLQLERVGNRYVKKIIISK